jgi:arylsulfatase A-like enzyme
MAALGYETAGFVNQGHLADYMGFDQGFDEYRFGLSDPQVEQEFAEWLQTREPGPFFAYLHLLDLHFPWNPPRHVDNFFAGEERPMRDLMNSDVGELRRAAEAGELSDSNVAELRAMYDGEVFVVDDRVGKILTALREVGVYDDAVIAVTADHGELLLEHGAFEHGGDFLYEGVLHIPWIMRLPGAEHAGARVSRTVQMADIFPTTTIFAGGTPPPDIAGQDALSLLGDPDRSWPIMAETSDPEGPRALYFGGYKFGFGRDSKVTVHDPRLDPMETRDLIDEIDASLLFGARQELLRLIAEHEDFQSRLTQTRAELRPEQVEKLRALGYIQ